MSATKILVIFPEDHSTKIAVYKNNSLQFLKKIVHPEEELAKGKTMPGQLEYRTGVIHSELVENEIRLDSIGIVISRGGLVKPMKSGVYKVSEQMKKDLHAGVSGQHSINLGGLIADALLEFLPNAQAIIADPVVVDELEKIARVTGHPDFQRKSIFHALNQKYISRVYARSLHIRYEDLNLVVAHMGGGGCSVAAHQKGKVVDVNQAFDGEGPFAITRTGTLPAGDLIRLCYSQKLSKEEALDLITSKGGLFAHLGSTSIDEIQMMLNNEDKHALFIIQSLAYQIAKEIAAMWAVLFWQCRLHHSLR
jgi:butyrate kinase